MAKSKAAKPSVMRTAISMRAEYRKWLALLAGGLAICIIAIFFYLFLVTNLIVSNEPGAAWIAAAIAAAVVGWFGNRFSKANRAYRAFLDAHRITNEEVNAFAKERGE